MGEEKICGFIMGGISLPVDKEPEEACRLAAVEIKRAGLSPSHFDISICNL